MEFLIESLKWFNETKNGSDFLTDPAKFTVNWKENTGERVKVITTFTYRNVFEFNPIANSLEVEIETGTFDKIILKNDSWVSLGFRVGDHIQVFDNQTNKIKADADIESIDVGEGTAAMKNITTLVDGNYTNGEIRDLTEFKKFQFNYDTEADLSGTRQTFNVFNAIQRYFNDVEVGAGGPRSTAFVNFVPRIPTNWNTGSFRMRYVDNPDIFTQRFELEHIFVVTPFHLEGYQYDPLIRPDEYKNGTLAYKYLLNNIEDAFLNLREVGSFDNVGSVGWFDENFDGGTNIYSVTSIDYFDLTNGININQINTNFTTRVTIIIAGDFVAAEPVTLHHSKRPTEVQYQNENKSFNDNFVFETLRNTIGAASNSNTIIQNLSINLDNPNQITVQVDFVYTGNEDIINGDPYILYMALETAALNAESSNRVNLILDTDNYVKNNDEPDLFILDKYEIFNHLIDIDVDTPNTDAEAYIEDGLLIDIEFRLKNDLITPRIGNKSSAFEDFSMFLVAFNTTDSTAFKITREERITGSVNIQKDGAWEFIIKWISFWRFFNFFLKDSDQFNKSQADSPTILTDIEYLSNDGTHGLYRAKIGIKLDWQIRRRLNENLSGGRVNNSIFDDYNENFLSLTEFDISDVIAQGLWTDITQTHNGYNKKISKYGEFPSWFIRPCIQIKRDNLLSSDKTSFLTFMPEFKIFDYDTNSPYIASSKRTFDLDFNDLEQDLIFEEDSIVQIIFDDGNTKTDLDEFEGIIRIQILNDPFYAIHELSTFRDTYPENILKGFGAGGVLTEKSIIAGKYTLTCIVDGTKLLKGVIYKITGRLFDKSAPFNPVTDLDLDAWYDASGLVTNTNNAFGIVSVLDEVSVWKNLKSDSNYNFSNVTVTEQPIFDSVNFKLDFDGVDDFLLWRDNNLFSQWTIFVVVEMTANAIANMFNVRRENLGLEDYFKDNIFMFQGEDGSNDPRGQVDAYTDAEVLEQVFETLSSVPVGSKAVFQYSMNYNGDWYIKVNNVRYDTPDDNMGTYDIPATNSLFLGGDGRVDIGVPNIQNVYLGHFHEMLIFPNADISNKEEAVYQYLRNKWDI